MEANNKKESDSIAKIEQQNNLKQYIYCEKKLTLIRFDFNKQSSGI